MHPLRSLIFGALLAAAGALPVAGQMGSSGMMVGARHSAIDLVSPPGSAAQLGRGMLMIGQPMGTMMMHPGQPASRAVLLQLRVAAVTGANGFLTSADNHLVFDGRLATASGESPVAVDQLFDLQNGAALVRVEIALPALTEPARLLIDRVELSNAGGETFAVPGIAISQPAASSTPLPTPHSGCQSNAECDDGQPDTQDLCMPMGCIHRPTHMGGGPMH